MSTTATARYYQVRAIAGRVACTCKLRSFAEAGAEGCTANHMPRHNALAAVHTCTRSHMDESKLAVARKHGLHASWFSAPQGEQTPGSSPFDASFLAQLRR